MSSEERRELVREKRERLKREREGRAREYEKQRVERYRRMEANQRIQDHKLLVDYMEGKLTDE